MKNCFLICALVLIIATAVFSQKHSYQPLSFHLDCSGNDCPLLLGEPQTAGMRSGFVRLKPGESVGEHSTMEHEEALVVLQGEGKAEVEGRPAIPIYSRMLTYIPPRSRHNVTNTGKGTLEYVYVVAPIAADK
jgi:mannose-6-phosphate isomerase-like protein (cupin superfamily)